MNLELLHQVKLLFANHAAGIRENLSAVTFSTDDCLWFGTDEYSRIERLKLSKRENHTFDEHKIFQLKDLIEDTDFNLDNPEDEVDIEGIDYENGYLWIIGSHSTKRKKAGVNPEKLKEVVKEPNRYLLARIPVNSQSELVKSDGIKKIAWLKQYLLTEVLSNDEYIGGIITSNLPGKDNGFDIEGLAVQNQQIFIGLRGPVLRGIAVLLKIEVEENLFGQLQLKMSNNNNCFYEKHFLDLDGLGIREICFYGNDLLLVAGPTMELDAPLKLYKLKQPFNLKDNSLSTQQNGELEYLSDIPHGPRIDRAEGLALYPDAKSNHQSILVVYDRPAPERLIDENGVLADIFRL